MMDRCIKDIKEGIYRNDIGGAARQFQLDDDTSS